MSSTSSDSEMTFDSEDTEMYYVAEEMKWNLKTFAPKSSHVQIFLKLWPQVENDKITLKA